MTGIEMIANERQEQLLKHGFTIEEDAKKYKDGQLAQVAVALIDGNVDRFPKDWQEDSLLALMGKDVNERLATAGAFIAAQIDVNDYIAAHPIPTVDPNATKPA